MFVPFVAPGVEERHENIGRGVEGAGVAPFPEIATDAGVGEVGRIRETPVLTADDVIDLVGRV